LLRITSASRAEKRIAVHAPLLIGGKALVGKLRDDADEVLPEVLFEDAERQALAVRGREDVVDREEVRARMTSGSRLWRIAAMKNAASNSERSRWTLFPSCSAASTVIAQGAAAHVGDGIGRARRRLEPLARNARPPAAAT